MSNHQGVPVWLDGDFVWSRDPCDDNAIRSRMFPEDHAAALVAVVEAAREYDAELTRPGAWSSGIVSSQQRLRVAVAELDEIEARP